MLTYEQVKRQPRRFLALTGLTLREFKIVLPAFIRTYQARYPADRTLTGKTRQRRPGGGRTAVLPTPEAKLLFVLVYQKTYPLQVVQGELFGFSPAQANYWIHRLLPVLQAALDDLGFTPERDGTQVARQERQRTERRDWIIDGTERRRQRPKNAEKQAQHYSMRKKAHTDKNVLIATRATRRVVFLSATSIGKTGDKKIADAAQISYPRGTRLRKDLGFEGYEPKGVQMYMPKKSRRGAN
jgi:hypothetical protein